MQLFTLHIQWSLCLTLHHPDFPAQLRSRLLVCLQPTYLSDLSIPNDITSSPLQRPLYASRCWSQNCFRRSRVLPRRSDNVELYQLISLIILTTCFYLILNAASKRTSTNFHSPPSHELCPRLRFVSLN